MYSAEQIFESLSYDDLHYTLKSVADEDCFLTEFLDTPLIEDFLHLLEVYDLIYIASDDRILLTPKGEKILQYTAQIVDLTKKGNKLNIRKNKL